MGAEKKILTEEMIDEKLKTLRPQQIRYVDPMKMAAWNLETAVEMVDGGCSEKTIERAIANGELDGIKAGKKVTVEPAKFMVWYRRHQK